MGARYRKGQRVRVLSVRNKYAKAKDSNIEQYEFEVGTIVDNFWAESLSYGQAALGAAILPKGYIYKVRMDKDDGEIAIEEAALEPVTD